MRKSKNRRKNRQKSRSRNKLGRPSPVLFLVIIAAALLFLYALPRHRYRKEQIMQTGVSAGSYPAAIALNAAKGTAFIPGGIPEKKKVGVVGPKIEKKIVFLGQPKEKAAAIEQRPQLMPNIVTHSSPTSASRRITKEVTTFGKKQEPKPEKQEPKPQEPELKLAKNSQTQASQSKKSNVNPKPRENKSTLIAKLPIEILPRIFRPKIKGKIAVVIDDWGYSFEYFELVKGIRQPLTLAILPNLAYSKRIAVEAKRKGFEVILHLPMEPYPREGLVLEKYTITCDMDDLKIRDILAEQIKRIPYTKGVSNHMGSKATEDSRVMRIAFEGLKEKKLYFLDSVTSDSVCARMAQEVKIAFARRDVFLDNENDPAYIGTQLEQLKEEARSRGYAIGIGHARRTTLEVLKEMMPKLQKEGFKFVTVSELLK